MQLGRCALLWLQEHARPQDNVLGFTQQEQIRATFRGFEDQQTHAAMSLGIPHEPAGQVARSYAPEPTSDLCQVMRHISHHINFQRSGQHSVVPSMPATHLLS